MLWSGQVTRYSDHLAFTLVILCYGIQQTPVIDRNKKFDTWKAITAELNYERLKVMKKLDTLAEQFRWEVRKLKPISDSGTDEVYNSSWFAFNSLTFLLDEMKPRSKPSAGMEVCNMSYRQYLLCIMIMYTTYTNVATASV